MNKLFSIRTCSRLTLRNISTKNALLKSAPAETETASAAASLTPKYQPTKFQKFILVWTKKYKTKEDIPKFVSLETLERARNETRIRIANILMILTAVGSFLAIMSGKAAAKRGQSVHQMNVDWHEQYNQSYMPNEKAEGKKD